MNYKKIYSEIINNRLKNPVIGYTESHHIVPKSIGGGGDNKSNLVDLSAREHFICHYLLTKIYLDGTIEWFKMNNAFMMMKMSNSKQDRYFNSILYESKRINFSLTQSKNQSGEGNSQFGTIWIYSEEHLKSIKIKKQEFPEYESLGWLRGRKNFKLLEESNIKKKNIQNKKDEKLKDKVKLLEEYHSIYIEKGFKVFVELTNYSYSKQNLVQNFKKYVTSFEPQNGKKR